MTPETLVEHAEKSLGKGPFRRFAVDRVVMLLIAAVFLLCAGACWYGFDRLPRISGTDEVGHNEPARALSRGLGVSAPAYEGMITSELFAHYPPLHVLLQSATFRIAGFSSFTLRFWSVTSHVLMGGLFLWVCHRLWRLRVLDGFGAAVAALAFCLEPSTVVLSRWGRIDPPAILLGMLAVAVLLPAPDKLVPSPWKWPASGILIGLALATYPITVIFWSACLALAFRMGLHHGQWRWKAFCLLVLPVLVAGSVWGLAYGARSFEAAAQFLMIRQRSREHMGFNFEGLIAAMTAHDARRFLQCGGTAILLVLGSWGALVVRGIIARRGDILRECPMWRGGVGIMLLLIPVHVLLIEFVTGMKITRVAYVFPFALLGLGMAISFLKSPVRFGAGVFLSLFLVLQGGMTAGYLHKVSVEWERRDPELHAGLVAQLPPEARVAGDPAFWYVFMKASRHYSVIDFAYIYDWGRAYWMDHLEKLNSYDYLIFGEGHPLLSDPILKGWTRREIPDIEKPAWLLENPRRSSREPHGNKAG